MSIEDMDDLIGWLRDEWQWACLNGDPARDRIADARVVLRALRDAAEANDPMLETNFSNAMFQWRDVFNREVRHVG